MKPTGLDKTAVVAVAESQQYVAAQPPLLLLQRLLLSCSFVPLDSDKSYTKHNPPSYTNQTKKKVNIIQNYHNLNNLENKTQYIPYCYGRKTQASILALTSLFFLRLVVCQRNNLVWFCSQLHLF